VADLVTDLLAPDPAERPASAGQAAERARDLLDRPMRPPDEEGSTDGGILLRDPPPELPKSA
jgi:hypothetical protein